jgi:predicted RNA-binding Zn-ribbon protein involved in translation (DUF1610 family)
VTLKLNVKRTEAPEPKRRVTQCPQCGFKGIEWKLTSHFIRHAYVCPECGYEGTVILETDEE